MIKDPSRYNLFFDFKNAYSPAGFKSIDRNDTLILMLEEMMRNKNQYLSVFDMLHMKTLFVSQGSIKFLGVKPEDLTSYHFKEATHPDDLKRQELGLVSLFKIAHELFVEKKGERILSSNFRLRIPNGNYTNQLVQCYFFYSPDPNNTVYLIDIKTDISWSNKIKHGFHYYLGNDLSFFRYPDEELLMTGNIFSEREFEIIKLVHEGLDSAKIAETLFLSKHTVNTHRKNILEKTGKAHISELIYDLHERGLL
jgi:DNA-binding CsgD family transcriptional regulator